MSTVRNTDLLGETSEVLGSAEERLLSLIRRGAQESAALDEILAGIEQLGAEIQPHFRRLDDALTRRDVPYDVADRLLGLRRHWLWLYRKIRLEEVFFTKLKVERGLRDALYRQVIEITHQLSLLDEQEKSLQAMDEGRLAKDLLTEAEASDGESPHQPWIP